MSIDSDTVERLAELAKLEVSEGDIEELRDELSSILEYVERLEELDLEGVEATTHAADFAPELREDDSSEGLTVSEALSNAPEAEESQFKVPKVVED
jgi:aspartyl-tRNA(Asn)/glutamyl-tRNA(Gln) amidotransferase subunit C